MFLLAYSLHMFQSTLPMKGATVLQEASDLNETVSIHAPNEGSDQSARKQKRARQSFNPRSQ